MAVGWPTKVTYANGDVYSASDVNDTNGTINLLTSSTLSSSAGKNCVINGGFDIWQRGTSTTLTSGQNLFTADRWKSYTAGATMTVSRQTTSDTTNLPSIQYCYRLSRASGATSTGILYSAQSLETTNSIPFAGKAVTFSFYARKGANYSATSSALAATLYSGTGTDQNWLDVAYTGQATVASGTATLTTTWQRFTYTGTVAATATELAVLFTFTPTGTAGAADYFEVTGVQVELGSTATTFSRAGAGGIEGELAACQRYYWRSNQGNIYSTYGVTFAQSGTGLQSLINLPVTMRILPSSVDYSTLAVYDGTTVIAVTSVAIDTNTSNKNLVFLVTTLASGGVQYRPYMLLNNNSNNAYLGFSAEL
jgi:hypothetical protein